MLVTSQSAGEHLPFIKGFSPCCEPRQVLRIVAHVLSQRNLSFKIFWTKTFMPSALFLKCESFSIQ